ncbi:MAG TPA: interleukin-like EMT inducer domain-containing protein [bacterium]|nr:interleukin-like EMT inducer domain-containing protein [bacterium]HQL61803.1 interleukin-like EMT inducer domain-containing protein [bacterium]
MGFPMIRKGFPSAVWPIGMVLFVFLIVFFWPILTPNRNERSHVGADLQFKDYPFRLFAVRELLNGHIPLWDEHLFGGWPGIANSELAFFYPPNLLLLPFWSEHGFSYSIFERWILLHLFFAGLGTAMLGRRHGLTNTAALLAGIILTFSGFLVAHKIHSNIIQTAVWLPWILLCLEEFLVEGRRMAGWLCGGCLICTYFGGHPQMAIYLTFVVLARLVWAVCVAETKERAKAFHRGLTVLVLVGVAGLATMVQWLPLRGLVTEGERARPTYESSSELSLPIEELVVDTVLPETVRLPGLDVGAEVFYWGITTTLIALFCIPVFRWKGPAGFYLLIAVVAGILALGDVTAAHRWAYEFIPGIAWLRASSRWVFVVTLAVALAAGRGLDALTRDRVFSRNHVARIYLGTFGVLFLCMFFAFLLLIVLRLFIVQGQISDSLPLLIRQIGWILLCLLLVVAVAVLYAQGKITHTVFSAFVVLLVFWDLATVHGTREIEPRTGEYVWDECVQTILDNPARGRVKIRFGPEGEDRRQYHGQVFGFRELDGESPLRPSYYNVQRNNGLHSLEDPTRINHRFLDLLNTEYILSDIPGPGGPWKPIQEHLWRNPDVSAPVRWYGSWWAVEPTSIPALLASQSVPYDRVALVGLDRFKPSSVASARIPGVSAVLPSPIVCLSISKNSVRHQSVILVAGENYSLNRTGYNIAVLDPQTGKVTKRDCFNTMADFDPSTGFAPPEKQENTRMARFLDSVPNGHIVLASIREEGTNILQENAVRALWSCGSGVDLRKRLWLAHSMIGVKGMPPGTAMEVVSATEALIMSEVDGAWFLSPPSLPSPEIFLDTRHFNARQLYEAHSRFPISMPPASSCRIGDGTAMLRVPLVLFSSPKDDSVPRDVESDRAALIVSGKDYAPNRRGYNLAWLDPINNNVVATDSFDIGMDWDVATGQVVSGTPENSRMIRFLENLPNGAIVIGAVRDEGCNILQSETIQALRAVGCELDLRKRFRWAHAFVGVKGATAGSAVEIASSTHVIIRTSVEGFPMPELNTPPPDLAAAELDAARSAQLTALQIPVLMSRGAKEQLARKPFVPFPQPAPTATQPETSAYPIALESDLRKESSESQWLVTQSSPEEIEIAGFAPKDGLLCISEPFFPDWKAWLDEEEVDIFPIFRFFRGIAVPAGGHTLRMVYDPPSFAQGFSLSCLGLVIWLGWGVWLLLNRSVRKTVQ